MNPAHWAAAALAMLSATGCGGNPAAPAAQTTPPTAPLALPAGYRLVWADEFNTDGLPDATRWAYDTGRNKEGWHNNERQYYAAARAENAAVKGGRLHITARREALRSAADWGGQAYTSARLVTAGKADWTYGYFEIRARLPCGQGTWPAIWMLGRSGGWPAGGELDIMEHVGERPTRVFSTVHTAAGSGGNGRGADTELADACSAFHTYQMHWTPDAVRFGIDGRTHFTYVNPKTGTAAWPFDAPQFLILNIAIGGDLGGKVDDAIFPVTMEVDFVRVYQAAR
jgi:beta-glucanase (GH16 family)